MYILGLLKLLLKLKISAFLKLMPKLYESTLFLYVPKLPPKANISSSLKPIYDLKVSGPILDGLQPKNSAALKLNPEVKVFCISLRNPS